MEEKNNLANINFLTFAAVLSFVFYVLMASLKTEPLKKKKKKKRNLKGNLKYNLDGKRLIKE